MTAVPVRNQSAVLPRSALAGFLPFVLLSAIHVGARALGADEPAAWTKLTLMPLLAVAAWWGLRGTGTSRLSAGRLLKTLLFAALFFFWLGDGAGAFFPFAPELPVMLGAFGVAHICYIRLMSRYAAERAFPRWALVFPLWWVLMLVLLWPVLGGLAAAVAAYGIVLAGTAATAARCGTMVASGGVLFLASDTLLSFRIFMPEAMPGWTSAMVMLTYCAGQGLIVAGLLRRRGA